MRAVEFSAFQTAHPPHAVLPAGRAKVVRQTGTRFCIERRGYVDTVDEVHVLEARAAPDVQRVAPMALDDVGENRDDRFVVAIPRQCRVIRRTDRARPPLGL